MVTAESLRTTKIIDAPLDPDAIKILGAKLRMSIDEETNEILWAEIRVAADHDDAEVQRAAEEAVIADATRA